MVELLSRFFIPDRTNYQLPAVRTAYGTLCGALGIVLNLLLFAGKFLAGTLSGSVAVTADAFNNLSDAGSSFISMAGFKLASQKPDPEHPFGHGRFEYIASFVISILILVMGFELGKSSLEKIREPEAVEYSILTFVILGVSVAVKLYMYLYNKKTGEKIQSASMKATAMDSVSDAVSTTAVLLSALISLHFSIQLDGWMGLVVAGFILYTGYQSAKETINSILGEAPDPEFVAKIRSIVLSHEHILGIHDMIVHNYGPGRSFVTLHAEVPSDGDIVAMHDVVDHIEWDIYEETGCLATIHMDPLDTRDEETNREREEVRRILAELDPIITFHDFRMVSGPTHTNVIFDVVVPYGYALSDRELSGKIADRIHEENEKIFAVITVDKDFNHEL